MGKELPRGKKKALFPSSLTCAPSVSGVSFGVDFCRAGLLHTARQRPDPCCLLRGRQEQKACCLGPRPGPGGILRERTPGGRGRCNSKVCHSSGQPCTVARSHLGGPKPPPPFQLYTQERRANFMLANKAGLSQAELPPCGPDQDAMKN